MYVEACALSGLKFLVKLSNSLFKRLVTSWSTCGLPKLIVTPLCAAHLFNASLPVF